MTVCTQANTLIQFRAVLIKPRFSKNHLGKPYDHGMTELYHSFLSCGLCCENTTKKNSALFFSIPVMLLRPRVDNPHNVRNQGAVGIAGKAIELVGRNDTRRTSRD